MAGNPTVFVSHASEDNARFVLGFAERLRSTGVDAWVDTWEMLPGDSLVDKIFNEGLKPSDAVIVVLSEFSINKPWVQKELNTAVVKSIEDKTRLIPIRIDQCDIPECLRDTLCSSIRDLGHYDNEFDRIVKSIYGQYEKPPLGDPPAWAAPEILGLGDLNRNDSMFLSVACRIAIEQGNPLVNAAPLQSALTKEGMSESDMLDAEEILGARGYLRVLRSKGETGIFSCWIETDGLALFADTSIPDFPSKMRNVSRLLVQRVAIEGGQISNADITSELGLAPLLVELIFERLGNTGLIKYGKESGPRFTVYWVSPELRRKMEGNSR